MAEYKVKINERTKRGKLLLEILRDYASSDKNIISIRKTKNNYVPNAETRKALKDAENGKTTPFKGWDDFEKDL